MYHEMVKTDEAIFDTKIDGGESLADVKVRTGEFLYEIDRTYKDESILFITHEHKSLSIDFQSFFPFVKTVHSHP